MKILILTQQLYPDFYGGSAKVARQQAELLADLGHQITVLTPQRQVMTRQAEDKIKVVYFTRRKKSQSWSDLTDGHRAIETILNAEKIDLVIIHHPYLGQAWLNLKKSIPYIYMFHASTALETKWQGLDWEKRGGWQKIIGRIIRPLFVFSTRRSEAKLLNGARQIWILSQFSRELIEKTFPKMVKEKIVSVNYAVDLEKFQPTEDKSTLRRELNLPTDKLIALTARRLVPRMGLEWLIDSWTNVTKKHHHSKLIIIGSGYLENALRQQIKNLNLENNISLIGAVTESQLIKYYQAANLFILPTLAYEGFGLATVEALATGLPVIGTNNGATPEIIKNFDRHLLLANTDSASLLNCLDYAIINKKELAAKARQFCEKNYHPNKMTIYQTLLDKIKL